MMYVAFFEKLKTFDKEELVNNEKLSKSVDAFIFENPDFTPEIVKNSSKACYSLCKWCFALTNYAQIAKQVQPK
jgi:dynein heavy chain